MRRIQFKHKIKRRRERRVKLNFLMFAVIFLITFTVCLAIKNSDSYAEVKYTVNSGDTLWGLSERYCSGDRLRWINKVSKLNNGSADIYTGETITILVEGDN